MPVSRTAAWVVTVAAMGAACTLLDRRHVASGAISYPGGEQPWWVPLQFMGKTLRTDARALIPRPETEQLCEILLAGPKPERVIDIGTGSGVLRLTRVQSAGRKAMSAAEFLKAHRLDGAVLGS